MPTTSYDKQAVINDIAENKLRPEDIAIKHGITVGNVYSIKSIAKRKGILNSRGYKTVTERMREEQSVLTQELRDRIKALREEDLTTTEITGILNGEGLPIDRCDVEKVMARAVNEYALHPNPRGKVCG